MNLIASLLLFVQAPPQPEAEALHPGAKTYENFCVSCHGKTLEGATGPCLTDEVWLHGSDAAAIRKNIDVGFAAKGMPAFDTLIPAEQKQALIDFILSRQAGLREVSFVVHDAKDSKTPFEPREKALRQGTLKADEAPSLAPLQPGAPSLLRFSGKLLVPQDGTYEFSLFSAAAELRLDGAAALTSGKSRETRAKVQLKAGSHDFVLSHLSSGGELGLKWQGPNTSGWLTKPLGSVSSCDLITVTDRAKVYRGNIQGQQSTRSLILGFPGGLSVVYDSDHACFTQLWQGGYLNVSGPRHDRGTAPMLPLGTALVGELPSLVRDGETPRFNGYSLLGDAVLLHLNAKNQERLVLVRAAEGKLLTEEKSAAELASLRNSLQVKSSPAPWIDGVPYAQEPVPELLPEGYQVSTVPLPPGTPLQTTGLAVTPRGEVFIASREGEVWKRGLDGRWQLFAEGQHEPCGLRWEEKTGELWISAKPELTAMKDVDGDGRADSFRTITAEWGLSGNYCEFQHGPEVGPDGSIYGTLNLGHDSYKAVHGTCMTAGPGLKRGTAFRLTPEGKYETFAWGLRSPAGTGMTPDGHFLFLDNQGDWMPTSYLAVAEKGSFHGHPAGMIDHPDYQGKDLNAVPIKEWADKRVPPAIYIPHIELANSPGNAVYDTSAGKFGPFAGQIFVGDQTQSNVFRCQLQQVKGVWQGCAIDFLRPLRCGLIRLAFAPDGSLWTCATSRGWGSNGDLPFAVQHITWDGHHTPFCLKAITHEKGGFRLSFTASLASPPPPEDLKISHWTYNFWPTYGSPKVGDTKVVPSSVTLAEDKMSLFVALPELVKRRCYGLFFPGLKDAKSRPVSSDHGWYTLNETED